MWWFCCWDRNNFMCTRGVSRLSINTTRYTQTLAYSIWTVLLWRMTWLANSNVAHATLMHTWYTRYDDGTCILYEYHIPGMNISYIYHKRSMPVESRKWVSTCQPFSYFLVPKRRNTHHHHHHHHQLRLSHGDDTINIPGTRYQYMVCGNN